MDLIIFLTKEKNNISKIKIIFQSQMKKYFIYFKFNKNIKFNNIILKFY